MVRKTKKRDNKNRTSRKKMRYNKAGKTRKMSGGGFMNFMKRQLSKVGSKMGFIMDSHGISKTINAQHNVNISDCKNFTNLNRRTRYVLTAFEKWLNYLKTTDTNENYHKYYTEMYAFYFNNSCTNLVKAINEWTAMSYEAREKFEETRLDIDSSKNKVNSRFFMFAMNHYTDVIETDKRNNILINALRLKNTNVANIVKPDIVDPLLPLNEERSLAFKQHNPGTNPSNHDSMYALDAMQNSSQLITGGKKRRYSSKLHRK